MSDKLGKESRFIKKIRESILESDMLLELSKKQKPGWASIGQISLMH
jgi:hypothetical protein